MNTRVVVAVCVLMWTCFAFGADEISSLLLRFQSERNVSAKEAILLVITRDHPDAGPQLLQLAASTDDIDSEWLAIRGLGHLKFRPATQFLLSCLSSPHHYVRANAARSLGDIRAYSAETELTTLLKTEQDSGVIEQTALALQMLSATKAVPVLKARAENTTGSQTKCWLIGAIGALGSRNDVSFVAKRLK